MLQLSEQSKLVRWTYFLRDLNYNSSASIYSKIPAQTTLCRFFWRCFVFMPLFWCLPLAFLTLVGMVIYMAYLDFGLLKMLLFSGAVTGGVALLFGSLYTARAVSRASSIKAFKANIANSTFVQGLKAIKSKVCPILRFY